VVLRHDAFGWAEELVRLSFDEAVEGVCLLLDDGEVLEGGAELGGLGEEPVADEDGFPVADLSVDGGLMASFRRGVDDVVLDEGGDVGELDHGGGDGGVAALRCAELRSEQREDRPDPLAAVADERPNVDERAAGERLGDVVQPDLHRLEPHP
jgi:hypothetical protein